MKTNITYFISGHRDLSQENFDLWYKSKIEAIIEINPDAKFVVGDCKGADMMAQDLLHTLGVDKNVTVFHMLEKPRYLASEQMNIRGGFKSDVERDSAMTEVSQRDIAFIEKGRWTSGTAQNILRRHEKMVAQK